MNGRVSFQRRKRWLLEQIAERKRIDVLDAQFVQDYAAYTGMKLKGASWGAGWCAQLSLDLKQMMRLRLLTRVAVGLSSGAWQPGFPKWVYSYSLSGIGRDALTDMKANMG